MGVPPATTTPAASLPPAPQTAPVATAPSPPAPARAPSPPPPTDAAAAPNAEEAEAEGVEETATGEHHSIHASLRLHLTSLPCSRVSSSQVYLREFPRLSRLSTRTASSNNWLERRISRKRRVYCEACWTAGSRGYAAVLYADMQVRVQLYVYVYVPTRCG
jgi:hypothetical protein